MDTRRGVHGEDVKNCRGGGEGRGGCYRCRGVCRLLRRKRAHVAVLAMTRGRVVQQKVVAVEHFARDITLNSLRFGVLQRMKPYRTPVLVFVVDLVVVCIVITNVGRGISKIDHLVLGRVTDVDEVYSISQPSVTAISPIWYILRPLVSVALPVSCRGDVLCALQPLERLHRAGRRLR